MEYSIRKPKSKDLIIASKIIKGIGLQNIVDCFNTKEVRDYIYNLMGNKGDDDDKIDLTHEEILKVGGVVAVKVAELALDKLENIGDDVFKFVSNLTEMTVEEVEDLPLSDFAEIFIKIIKEPDFVDFIKVVLKSFN